MTLGDLYQWLRAEVDERDARIIIKERTGYEWSAIIAAPDTDISSESLAQIKTDLRDHKNGKPLSRIYGQRDFWGMTFTVNEHVLDPRPDSETLIDAVLSHYSAKRETPKTILDLGTGSGCLLLSLLGEFPDAQGQGVDISVDALRVAKDNAKKLGLESRATLTQSNWFDDIEGAYDLIISNPPYIESDVIPNLDIAVKDYDPIHALDGGKDGLQDYNQIFSKLSSSLNPQGFAIVEIGFDQAESVPRLIEKHGLKAGKLHHDLAGNPRAVEIFLPE